MECSCKNKSNYPVVVSIDNEKLKTGDMNSVARLSFALNPIVFVKRMNDLGIKMDNHLEDLNAFVELNKMGEDVKGLMKNAKGDSIKFNFKEFIKDIPIDDSCSNPIKIEMI